MINIDVECCVPTGEQQRQQMLGSSGQITFPGGDWTHSWGFNGWETMWTPDTKHWTLDTGRWTQTRGGCVIKIANMLWPQLQSYRAKDFKIFAVWGWIVPDSFLCVWEFYHIFSINAFIQVKLFTGSPLEFLMENSKWFVTGRQQKAEKQKSA